MQITNEVAVLPEAETQLRSSSAKNVILRFASRNLATEFCVKQQCSLAVLHQQTDKPIFVTLHKDEKFKLTNFFFSNSAHLKRTAGGANEADKDSVSTIQTDEFSDKERNRVQSFQLQ